MKKLVVLSGAGISAESGIKTFRDADGLWEGHDVMQVASPGGWSSDAALVLDFYNQRRKQLLEVEPNDAHRFLVELESLYEVKIITQNVDDLHERAGSKFVLHLHGELLKVRSEANHDLVLEWHKDLNVGDLASDGAQLRPHIVWFGEEVPLLGVAATMVSQADIVIIIGTSLQVYPAAGLVGYSHSESTIIYVDPKPASSFELERRSDTYIIEETAVQSIPSLKKLLQ